MRRKNAAVAPRGGATRAAAAANFAMPIAATVSLIGSHHIDSAC